MNIKLLAAAAAGGCVLAAGGANATIMAGDTVQLNYLYPDTSSVYSSVSTTYAGPGTTLPIIYTGVASFSANLIVLAQSYSSYYSPAPFNGVELSDLTNPLAFAGWGVLPGTTTAPITEFSSGGSLFVNWQGAPTTGVVNLGLAVPEPATWTMLLAGFAGLGGALRATRRRTVPATA